MGLLQPAQAETRTAAEVEAMAVNAVGHLRNVGREQAFTDFNRPTGGFVDGDLYVFCLDVGGTVIAHGGNPNIVGRDMSSVRDPDGRLPNAESIALGLSKGSGWLEYRWPNPVTKRIEPKVAFVLKVDDRTVCGSGYYKSDVP